VTKKKSSLLERDVFYYLGPLPWASVNQEGRDAGTFQCVVLGVLAQVPSRSNLSFLSPCFCLGGKSAWCSQSPSFLPQCSAHWSSLVWPTPLGCWEAQCLGDFCDAGVHGFAGELIPQIAFFGSKYPYQSCVRNTVVLPSADSPELSSPLKRKRRTQIATYCGLEGGKLKHQI
jgi:hypothetical protein